MKNLICTLLLATLLALPRNLPATEKLTLMLDWFPNVDHLPIYVARERGFFADHNISVDIVTPSETSDALKLAAAGHMDIAVSYQPQTIIAADQGLDIQAVAPLISHPLTTLLFLDDTGITTPADLSGKSIGYTVPGLMDVMLHAFADINQIKAYTPVNVGFTILPALVSKKVAAVMGPFKTYETVTMAQHGYTARFFELEKWGIPRYEELIFVCGTRTLKQKNRAIRGFVTAIEEGLAYTRTRPEKALALYLAALPQADQTIETRAFALTLPFFATEPGHDHEKWQAFADFALARGLVRQRVETRTLIHTWPSF